MTRERHMQTCDLDTLRDYLNAGETITQAELHSAIINVVTRLIEIDQRGRVSNVPFVSSEPNMDGVRAAAQRGKDRQEEARKELETLLPGVVYRTSSATGTFAVFSPGPKARHLGHNWIDALAAYKQSKESR